MNGVERRLNRTLMAVGIQSGSAHMLAVIMNGDDVTEDGWVKAEYGSPEHRQKISDALRGPNHPHWVGDEAVYRTAHRRIQIARGKASEQACAHCGKPALHWALSHEAVDDLKWNEKENLLYSTDPNNYIPLCVSCHVLYDQDDPESLVGATPARKPKATTRKAAKKTTRKRR